MEVCILVLGMTSWECLKKLFPKKYTLLSKLEIVDVEVE